MKLKFLVAGSCTVLAVYFFAMGDYTESLLLSLVALIWNLE